MPATPPEKPKALTDWRRAAVLSVLLPCLLAGPARADDDDDDQPRPPPALSRAPVPACPAPAGSGPFVRLNRPIGSTGDIRIPGRAAADQVSGCAGVQFHLGADGAPRDLSVLVEKPPGYGFGATVEAAIKATRWPPGLDRAWHYLSLAIRVRAAGP